MMNKIWFGLLFVGIVYGFGKATYQQLSGTPPINKEAIAENGDVAAGDQKPFQPIQDAGQALTNATLESAELAVSICLGLIGVMVLWLGLMNVAKDAGMVDAFAYMMRPLMHWLFPDVPDGHPAQGAMLMNMSANMLGLDNAATPFGLQAMRELQKLNPTSDTATNAMAMFLAINTSNVTLIPISIIAFRHAAESENPASPIAGIILATAFSTIVAILVTKMLAKSPRNAMPLGNETEVQAN